MRRPRIGYARLLVAGNVPNYSTIMDSESVIMLGHSPKEPLMRPSSELSDGFEPHGLIYSSGTPVPTADSMYGGEGCTRGSGSWVGAGGVLYRVPV